MKSVANIPDRLAQVKARVAKACTQAQRTPDDVGLIAVSKTFELPYLEAPIACGQRDFGESYAQELRTKAQAHPELRWHFIGRIQRNKAKWIAPAAYRVHSLESREQAMALSRYCSQDLHCLLAVNSAGEATKSGVLPANVIETCKSIMDVPNIQMCGLMCLPPYTENPADNGVHFETLRSLAKEGLAAEIPLEELSMGMSHDFETAILYGATWIRVGSAIFGPRN